MPSSNPQGIRQQLEHSVEQISRVPADQVEAGVSAFNAFRRSVTQASSGREVPPDELLWDLEPKDVVWRFLVQLSKRKPMYRKQVVAAASVLMSCQSWLDALQAMEDLVSELPPEMEGALKDACAATPAAQGDDDEAQAPESQDAQVAEEPTRQRQPRQSRTQRALDLLVQGKAEIEALKFSASSTDDAISAFNTFQRAVMWVVASPQKEDDEALGNLENKDLVLSFILDFYTRKPTHRLRIAALFVRLLGFDEWRAAIRADHSVRAAVSDMTKDMDLSEQNLEEQSAAISLEAAAQEAAARGCVGALYVRVIAAHDLVAGDTETEQLNLHVKLAIGDVVRRTDSVAGSLSPRWLSAPFLFEVPSLRTPLRLEVLDTDYDKDESFGTVEIPIADLPKQLGSSFSRYSLDCVTHGELELELVFQPTDAAVQDGSPGNFLIARGDKPAQTVALTRQWSMTTQGKIFCPAGHEVDEFKEGKRTVWGTIGARKDKQCNVCNCNIRNGETRWRCGFHCDFRVCGACYDKR